MKTTGCIVLIAAQVGHCCICQGKRICRAADRELCRPLCPFCVLDVDWADRLLAEGAAEWGMRRPVAGTLLDR